MKALYFLIFVLSISVNTFAAWPLRDTVEFSQRDGLPNFFAKATIGDSLKVGFIGGSITNAVGWRDNIINWLKTYYNNNKIIQVNAAINGTSSTYGVFRIEKDLLSKCIYDLIFIEFAVNDNGSDADTEKSMEGLFRKIWAVNPKTDICMIYTVSQSHFTSIAAGKMNLSTSKHDSIASYYKIPSIFLGNEVYRIINSDTVSWYSSITDTASGKNSQGKYVFTVDNLHPTPFGYTVYTKIIARSFLKMENENRVFNHSIPISIVKNNYENAQMIPISKAFNYGMTWVDRNGIYNFMDSFMSHTPHDNYICSENSNSYYSFTFTGSKIGLSMLIGPSVGKYVVEIDKVAYPQTAFDNYCSYYRQQFKTYDVIDGTHTFKVYPSADTLTIAEKTTERTSPFIKAHPADYCYNNLIISHIMLIGTINSTTNVNTLTGNKSDFAYYSTNGQIYIKSQNLSNSITNRISIFNSNGQLVCNQRLINQNFCTQTLHKGFYLIQIQGNSLDIIKAIVI